MCAIINKYARLGTDDRFMYDCAVVRMPKTVEDFLNEYVGEFRCVERAFTANVNSHAAALGSNDEPSD